MKEKDVPYEMISKRNEAFYYLGFIVWPFGIMLAAFRNWERSWSKNIFWIFCIFFGATFIIAKDSIESADSVRYAQVLTAYAYSDMSFGKLWQSFYSESSSYVDIAQPVITFLVSRFTDNPHILFAVFGMIFGFFYSRNIWYVLDHINGKITLVLFLYILTFAMVNPIWNINGFRMWTAAQIFLYGTLPYLMEGNIKRLFWSGFSVFFHFSFILPLIILLLFILLKNRITIYLTFFLATSFLKEINLQSVQYALAFLPDIFQTKVTSYTNLEYAENVTITQQALNWYIPFSSKAVKWVTYALVLFIYFSCRKILDNRKELNTLFCYSLLLYSFANIFSLIPSGGRFLVVGNTFMFAFFIIFLSISSEIKGMGLIKTLSMPFLLLFCIVMIRTGMDFYGFTTIIGNPLIAVFNIDTDPLITGIKKLF